MISLVVTNAHPDQSAFVIKQNDVLLTVLKAGCCFGLDLKAGPVIIEAENLDLEHLVPEGE